MTPNLLKSKAIVSVDSIHTPRHNVREEMWWGCHDSRFGLVLAAMTERGLCWLGFVLEDVPSAVAQLAARWPLARLIEDASASCSAVDYAFGALVDPPALVLYGTAFQTEVWRALLCIPVGTLVSYHDIAKAIGRPAASRAVGRAIGANPVSILVPCHRVISKGGGLHGYAWGVERKRALLAWEVGCRG